MDNSREGQSRYERPILLNLGEKALQLEDGAKYLITYDFYIENGCNGNMSIDFASAGLTNTWDDRTSFTKVVDVLQSGFEHKTWLLNIKHRCFCPTPTNVGKFSERGLEKSNRENNLSFSRKVMSR